MEERPRRAARDPMRGRNESEGLRRSGRVEWEGGRGLGRRAAEIRAAKSHADFFPESAGAERGRMTRLISGCIAALVLASVVVAEDASDTILARAPSGAFSLITKAEGGPIWLVPANDPGRATQLPPVRVTAHEEGNWRSGLKEVSSDDV